METQACRVSPAEPPQQLCPPRSPRPARRRSTPSCRPPSCGDGRWSRAHDAPKQRKQLIKKPLGSELGGEAHFYKGLLKGRVGKNGETSSSANLKIHNRRKSAPSFRLPYRAPPPTHTNAHMTNEGTR